MIKKNLVLIHRVGFLELGVPDVLQLQKAAVSVIANEQVKKLVS